MADLQYASSSGSGSCLGVPVAGSVKPRSSGALGPPADRSVAGRIVTSLRSSLIISFSTFHKY
jgi:hypothetical protein